MQDKRGLLVEENQTTLFRMYKSYRTIGSEIKDDFLGLQGALEEKDGRYVFHMNENKQNEGILSQTYGLFLLSSITDRFEVLFSSDETECFKNSVISLIDYVNKHGYDVSPYSTSERNAQLFGVNGDAFIESVTWVLSCLLYARRLHKSGKVDFTAQMPIIIQLVSKSFKILIDNVIHDDGSIGYKKGSTDYIGWGSVTRCSQISLYFTHSVCETFGDLEDTALGNKELKIARDNEFIGQINTKAGADIVNQFVTICGYVGENIYKKYKTLLGKNFFYADGSVASLSQISCSIQTPVLLNQLYVVLSAIYTNYYKQLNNPDDYKEFMSISKNAVDMVYETYMELKSAGKHSIVDRDVVTFSEKHPNKDISKYLASERINVSILEALIVKAKNMIVTYVSKYPEKEIDTIMDVIEDNHVDNKWIWSEMGFDLQQTERCVSAIREFYDYYDIYVRKYAEIDADENLVNKDHSIEISKLLQSLEEEKKRHADAIKELKRENSVLLEKKIKEAKDCNYLDAAAVKLIDNMLEGRIADTITDLLLAIFEDSKESAVDTLTAEQRRLKNSVTKLAHAFLIPIAQEVKNNNALMGEWSTGDIIRAFSRDAQKVVSAWMVQIAGNNRANDERLEGFLEMLEIKGGKQ